MFRSRALVVLVGLTLLACGEREGAAPDAEVSGEAVPEAAPGAGNVDGARIAAADSEPGSWLAHGRTYSEQRFSPLAQITRENVTGLGLVWSFDLDSSRGVEATPIVVDGVMYVSAPWSVVHALDARTGAKLWSYDPKVPGEWARHACCDVVNRGVAVWKGAVFVGTIDGRLVSLDAATGTRNWEVQTTDPNRPYSITGAPRVVKDKVVIGNGGAERGVRGYITAYDAASGEQVWRFYTVPGNPAEPFEHPELEAAAATWTGEWWHVGGGGTAWDGMAYDPALDLLYVGTGNGSPWTRYQRSPGGGDNLFLCSILALRPDTGELAWYYQTTPSDNWDYTSVQPMILADLEIDGRTRQVIMQAPKNGFFYVLDRRSGELISAEPYVVMNWASGVDLETGRPIEIEGGNYDDEARLIFPGPPGGHNWHPMSFSPQTGLVYIPAMDIQFWYAEDEGFEQRPGEFAIALDLDELVEKSEEVAPEVAGFLLAWDPVAQKEAWRVEHPGFWNGGVLTTAGGLAFQGTADGRFVAYDAASGEKLWEAISQTGIMAGPVSYAQGGEQYVAVAAGLGGGVMAGPVPNAAIERYHNEGRVLVFKLGGSAPMPTNAPRDTVIPAPPPLTASAEQVAAGKSLYNRFCLACHGLSVASSWVVPDLRYMSPERHEAFEEIVYRGILSGTGMPRFAGYLQPEEVALVHGYIIGEAQRAYDDQQQPSE
jgi:PQQ-dependent dehydrogenase (methanol/ethanol family)